jgi:hypothetical protein
MTSAFFHSCGLGGCLAGADARGEGLHSGGCAGSLVGLATASVIRGRGWRVTAFSRLVGGLWRPVVWQSLGTPWAGRSCERGVA